MLGRETNIFKEERFKFFYDYIHENLHLGNSTFFVDKDSKTFLLKAHDGEADSSSPVDIIYLKDSNGVLSEAEIFRLLNYKFEGRILPEIEVLDANLTCIRNSAVEFSLRIKNVGKVPLFGIGTQRHLTDRICIRLTQGKVLLKEYLLDFPYRIIKPDEEISLHCLIDDIELAQDILKLRFGLFKENFGWITPKEDLYLVELNIEEPFKSAQVDISKIRSQNKIIALTFNGGDNATPSDGALEILAETNTKATFFLTGSFIKTNPDYTKRIFEAGHEIGNHTNSHPRLCHFNDPEPLPNIDKNFILKELEAVSDLLLEVTGTRSANVWRAPFGAKNSLTCSWAYSAGYTHIFWNFDSHDWRVPDKTQADWKEERRRKNLVDFLKDPPNGSILLMHTGVNYSEPTLKASLIEAINALKARGFEFVMVGNGE